jgi:hypothetical protein
MVRVVVDEKIFCRAFLCRSSEYDYDAVDGEGCDVSLVAILKKVVTEGVRSLDYYCDYMNKFFEILKEIEDDKN